MCRLELKNQQVDQEISKKENQGAKNGITFVSVNYEKI